VSGSVSDLEMDSDAGKPKWVAKKKKKEEKSCIDSSLVGPEALPRSPDPGVEELIPPEGSLDQQMFTVSDGVS
jgi:hypothetical protein